MNLHQLTPRNDENSMTLWKGRCQCCSTSAANITVVSTNRLRDHAKPFSRDATGVPTGSAFLSSGAVRPYGSQTPMWAMTTAIEVPCWAPSWEPHWVCTSFSIDGFKACRSVRNFTRKSSRTLHGVAERRSQRIVCQIRNSSRGAGKSLRLPANSCRILTARVLAASLFRLESRSRKQYAWVSSRFLCRRIEKCRSCSQVCWWCACVSVE